MKRLRVAYEKKKKNTNTYSSYSVFDFVQFWKENNSFEVSYVLSTIVEDEQLHWRETEAAGTRSSRPILANRHRSVLLASNTDTIGAGRVEARCAIQQSRTKNSGKLVEKTPAAANGNGIRIMKIRGRILRRRVVGHSVRKERKREGWRE